MYSQCKISVLRKQISEMRFLQVSQLQPGGPAEAGGVRVGDMIDAVDSQSMHGRSQVHSAILNMVLIASKAKMLPLDKLISPLYRRT